MRILVLGGTGMLGHKAVQLLAPRHEVWTTLRRDPAGHPLFRGVQVISGIDVTGIDAIVEVLARVRPEAVLNCIGVVKQAAAANSPLPSLTLNSLFPHRLAALCRASGARLIHISTDCVFSGRSGRYTEASTPDAEDLYGRTKLLGEVQSSESLTIRTSMIGREISAQTHGLVEWFLAQQGRRVKGFRHAVFSGFTTAALASVIGRILEDGQKLNGLYHVAADPISKLDLLGLLKEAFGVVITIDAADEPAIDRSLDGARFANALPFTAPSWPRMIDELATDGTPYDEWRIRNDF